MNTLIYGQFDNELVRINGDLNIDGLYTLPNTAPSSGQFLRYNGGANLTWNSIEAPWDIGSGDDVIYENGDVGVGIGNPIYRLDVLDNVSTGFVARFHKTFEGGLATLEKINPAIYQMKSNPTQDEIGFIAQELQKVLPIAVGGEPTDDVEESPMTVDYGRVIPVLVAAIKEQQELIQNQQKVIDALNARLDNQDDQFSQLKAEILKMKGAAEN